MYSASRTTFLFLIFQFFATILPAQNFDSACIQQKHVLNLLQRLHYDPPHDGFGTREEIVDLFVKAADEKNMYFMYSDVAALKGLAKVIPSPDVYCALTEAAYAVIHKRQAQLDSIAVVIEKSPLVLDGSDTLHFVFRKNERIYFSSMEELHKRIEKRIKYKALAYLTRQITLPGDTTLPQTQPDSSAIERAKHMALHRFRHSLKEHRQPGSLAMHLSDCMSGALAQRCDPHSSYLSASSFARYRNALSTHESSFGFSVGENKTGDLVLEELIPGGPAWKSNALNEDDLIAGISLNGKESLPLAELSADEINQILHKTAGDTVNVTVIKKDLQIRSVELRRENIRSAGNILNSYVVQRDKKRIGFIPIPSFYLDHDGEGHQGCANDVAKEIIELRKDSVEGIILDLRYNGGGSMREAIALAGIFIDEGPVAIYRHRGDDPFLLKDLNRGTIWEGPLLILINSASASASEFVTATLQDYNRAIVAGSESFGKGTAQTLIPADSNALSENFIPDPNAGFLKVTGGKFYRVTSRSHQGKGIVPDIYIPGVIEKVLQRESSFPYFLACDSVEKEARYKALPSLPVADLRNKSAQRLNAAPRFHKIGQLGDSLRSVSHLTEKVPLSMQDFLEFSRRQKELHRQMEQLFTGTDPGLKIRNSSANEMIIAMDPYLRRSSERTLAQLQKDVTFHESVKIMNDMIDLSMR